MRSSSSSLIATALAASSLVSGERYRQPAAKANVAATAAALAACPSDSSATYDYIVVGSGAGGDVVAVATSLQLHAEHLPVNGLPHLSNRPVRLPSIVRSPHSTVATRLALTGFKVLLVDAGKDVQNYNTTIPFYFAKASEDPQMSLGYYTDLYQSGTQVTNWYPRSGNKGGATLHNAMITADQSKYDFDQLASITGDSSFLYTNMRQYFKKVEKNIWLPSNASTYSSHGTSGWLSVDVAQAPSNPISDPAHSDTQLFDLYNGTVSQIKQYPNSDFNAVETNVVQGGGLIQLAKDSNHLRSSVRDRIAAVEASAPTRLTFFGDTLVTKILSCSATSSDTTGAGVKAYGIQYASGHALLPEAVGFKGKQTLLTKTMTAKYEIISGGAYETPHLLMLSGIGDASYLARFGINSVVNSPGIGLNFQDRVENTISWDLKANHKVFEGCTLGQDPSTDPCLKTWIETRSNLYSSGPAIVANVTKSSPNLPYNDLWTMFTPRQFTGYMPGYSAETSKHPNAWSAVILKAHTHASGEVDLISSNPQDGLHLNKNLLATAGSKNDYAVIREAIKDLRKLVANTPQTSQHISKEVWPGLQYTTDAQLDDFLRQTSWGHHACCTAKIGKSTDSSAVLDGNFKVHGISRLRVVDTSAWPNIPGFFISYPTYALAEKAADALITEAGTHRWTVSA